MTGGPAGTTLAAPVLRDALMPMVAFYLILMAALGLGLLGLRGRGAGRAGGPQRRPSAGGPSRGWAALARHVLGTAIGGYLLLIAVVVAYYYGVTRVGGTFLGSAVTGTALLIGLSMPVFAVASWISGQLRGRHGKPPGRGK